LKEKDTFQMMTFNSLMSLNGVTEQIHGVVNWHQWMAKPFSFQKASIS
jgi:hypothetical protein